MLSGSRASGSPVRSRIANDPRSAGQPESRAEQRAGRRPACKRPGPAGRHGQWTLTGREKVTHNRAVKNKAAIYDDGRIACDDEGITIRWYYLWGARRIPYRAIRSARTFTLKPIRGKWRIWGSGDFVHWYNLDSSRPGKDTGIEIDTGGRVRPCITPDDVDTVTRIIAEHIAP